MQDKEFDFKKTLFLPDTSFPMRASLPTREPGWLEHWNRLKIYYKLRERVLTEKLLFFMMAHRTLMAIYILVMLLIKS